MNQGLILIDIEWGTVHPKWLMLDNNGKLLKHLIYGFKVIVKPYINV